MMMVIVEGGEGGRGGGGGREGREGRERRERKEPAAALYVKLCMGLFFFFLFFLAEDRHSHRS